MHQLIEQLSQLIAESKRTVVFTGAGISTESGIPDFRGPQGLWTTGAAKSIDFNDFIASEELRRESWRNKLAGGNWSDAEPNKGHLAVAELVRRGKVTSVITQNVDNLHQKSGIPPEQVIELHGNSTFATCLDCGKRFELAEIREIFSNDETLPYCDVCHGIIKTATISFGQAMPLREVQFAEQESLACDLFIALGSSLVVYPAASFPRIAHQNGAKLVIVNNQPTDLDPMCDLVLQRPIGETLHQVVFGANA